MIKIMDIDGKRTSATGAKFILAENLPLDGAELMPYMPHNLTINELGKQLLKASTEGNVEEIRTLMGKGAPFTADWLGTSPLHLAAQNNHLEVCEILLRAGMSRDARTKVDRTPLHMAAYEGHSNIVECLLKNGADYDCKDLLHMTPLHWAAQNGHTDIAATLIRYGATTNVINKFDLTPIDIALQINRPDIVHVINLSIRDPIVATEHLALELISENSTESTIDPTIAIQEESNEIEESETDNPNIPFETIMIEAAESSAEQETSQYEQQTEENLPESIDKTIEAQGNNAFTESMKLLQQHGITMLPVDDSNILNSVMESGHSVVLTEAGKQALNSIKSSETNHDLSQFLKAKPKISTIKKKKIITLTPEQYLAMASNGTISSAQTNILKQINGKVINQAQKTNYVKRVVMKKNKISPISHGVNVTKIQKIETHQNVESLMEQLQKAQTIIESYKRKLLKSEVEAARYKQQLKIIMEQNKLSTST